MENVGEAENFLVMIFGWQKCSCLGSCLEMRWGHFAGNRWMAGLFLTLVDKHLITSHTVSILASLLSPVINIKELCEHCGLGGGGGEGRGGEGQRGEIYLSFPPLSFHSLDVWLTAVFLCGKAVGSSCCWCNGDTSWCEILQDGLYKGEGELKHTYQSAFEKKKKKKKKKKHSSILWGQATDQNTHRVLDIRSEWHELMIVFVCLLSFKERATALWANDALRKCNWVTVI